ncbi:MAG TPA: DUF3618 domain-containing protein [Solirubrobacteraceae bacterium]|nr:DUF3618 domain-containing protein [Solirubrobacteraceae bacterium]
MTKTPAQAATEPGNAPGAATGGDSRDPERLRAEIEETRRELGETVAALSAKTDVKAQAKERIEEAKASVAGKKEALLGRAREMSPDSARAAASTSSEKVRQNPVPAVAAAGFLAGFLIGRLSAR